MDTDIQQRGHGLPSPPISTRRASVATIGSGAATPKMTHDSLVTVRLSEPDALTLNTEVDSSSKLAVSTPLIEKTDDTMLKDVKPKDVATPRDSLATLSPSETTQSLQDELQSQDSDQSGNRTDEDDEEEDDTEEVNWEQLEKTEDEQTKDEETDNSTAMLLARLEQENAKLATNPKSVKVQPVERVAAMRPRPPSMAQLRQMVHGPTPPALRYSMLPPPPMTDLEFYAALVKDYQQTAARLPTLLSNKIRKGIPPPLRGVVWQSMSGARDASLEDQYERFCGETSPYELIIGKDLGRSFPGVDMFRDPEGDGQRMLGRVLKCFSLYDTKIGYCQGLAFLVGPLLMHMPDKQAFCVLVRLMEHYDLRACFLPDLSGLHVRIYQFRELLRQNLPTLSDHLDDLQVDPAYVSQWFLSFFAVTCPLPMLFRIYDVVFAEGASETLMRVALSLMQKNEGRLLACQELEDVMQLLLSRGLWDCYHYNTDEFVHDFAGLSTVVSREKLRQLEQGYRESLVATTNATRSSDITTAATRFLGRIWATSTSLSPRSASTLSPGLSAPSRPLSMLRRSTSKQSLASTLNSMEASSASVVSSSSTDATTISRDSSITEDGSLSRESTPVAPKTSSSGKNNDERYLHSQIEDLLMALSELQRNHTLLTNQLQREKEERQEDRKVVQSLLGRLRRNGERLARGITRHSAVKEEEEEKAEEAEEAHKEVGEDKDEQHSNDDTDGTEDANGQPKPNDLPIENLASLIDLTERRFGSSDDERPSTAGQSKGQMRQEMEHMKDQLAGAMSQSQEYSRRIHDLNQEMLTVKEQLRESHTHVRTLHQDKQRLERQIHGLRARASSSSAHEAARESDNGGLREFKLLRSKSTPSGAGSFNKRMSSLSRPHDSNVPVVTTTAAPSSEHDALLLELVEAKTAQAMAKQEAEEAKQKLEALRKAYGLAPGELPNAASGPMAVFGRLTGQAAQTPAADTANTSPSGNGGGFWGWRR